MTSPHATLYLVRHGETEWNVNSIIMGHHDSPLTPNGIEQVNDLATKLESIQFDAIYSSDSGRCQHTAKILRAERQLAITASKALRERCYGEFEGGTLENYKEKLTTQLQELETLTGEARKKYKIAPDIESDEEITTRFIGHLREIAVAHAGQTVLVVSHGGCLRTFLARTGYASQKELPSGSFGNAGYIKVRTDGLDFFIEEVKGIKIPTS